jgi:ABC-2 type transport system permease protein
MITLVKHELFKLFKRVKTLVVVIGFILLTGLMAYGLHKDAENMKMYSSPEFRIKDMERSITHSEEQKKNIPPDIKDDKAKADAYVQRIDEDILQMKDEISKLKALSGKGVDWKEDLNVRIEQIEKTLKEEQSASSETKSRWNQELEQLKYLKDHNIKPMESYDFNAFNYIGKYISILGQAFLIIGLAVFASDMVSGECTPPTLKLLLTQPVSRGKVIFSKFIAITIAAVGSILLIELLSFLIVGLIYGFGNASYPVMVGYKYQLDPRAILNNGAQQLSIIAGSAHIIPMWKYTINLLLMQGLFIITCTSFAFMISTLVKSSMVSMGISTVSMIAMTILFNSINALKKLSMYVFTSYIDMGAIIEGHTAQMFNNTSSTLGSAIIIFAGWTIVCYLISHFVFTKKDILI